MNIFLIFKKNLIGALGWLSRLGVRLQLRSWSRRSVSSSPASGSVLTARSLEPASDFGSPSLSALPLLMLCLKDK